MTSALEAVPARLTSANGEKSRPEMNEDRSHLRAAKARKPDRLKLPRAHRRGMLASPILRKGRACGRLASTSENVRASALR